LQTVFFTLKILEVSLMVCLPLTPSIEAAGSSKNCWFVLILVIH
jgi:hypothetical protein